jgi:prevent-host-death family protein
MTSKNYQSFVTVTVTEFKAKCLNLIDQVHKYGQPVIITKHGKVIAKLVAEHPTKPIEITSGSC